jgi:hypothetical protein
MKSNFLIFSFSHWGLTQLTNKRVKRIAYFYSTNLRTYILYILFVSIFTIKYILLFLIRVNNIHLLVSKICEPPDLFLSPRCLAEFQERFLRCSISDGHGPGSFRVDLYPNPTITLTLYVGWGYSGVWVRVFRGSRGQKPFEGGQKG